MTKRHDAKGKTKKKSLKGNRGSKSEKGNKDGNGDHLHNVLKSTGERTEGKTRAPTNLSSVMGEPLSSSSRTKRRTRKLSRGELIGLILALALILLLSLAAILLLLRDKIFGGDDNAMVQSTQVFPGISVGTNTATFKNLTNGTDSDEDDAFHNETGTEYDDDEMGAEDDIDEEEMSTMVVIEVTERKLTPVEIDAAGDIDIMAQKRAKERYWEATELSVGHGNRNRKRSLNENEPYSETCEPCRYYQNLSSWDRTELQLHLRATHQNSLSYESDFVPDTWDALVDVDRGVDTGADDRSPTVRLLYSNNTISAWRNQSRTTERVNRWNREHVWPRARGVFHSGPDNRDIHHLFPASVIANEARANRYFGECMNESADEDPENYRVCGSVFQPPQSARGVVARALFYIDLRYSDSGNLLLTDDETDGFFAHRNDDGKYIMGSLSTLLKWHEEYPPGPSERTVLTEEQRNHRVCSRWQGNRNPFVDFPDLAKIIYQNHTMEDIGGNPFASCGNESEVSGTPPSDTTANTGIIQDDEESNIIVSASDDNEEVQPEGWPSPGDVMIVGVHTDNRDADNRDSVALVALRDLPAGWVIRITDNPYNQTSSEFESREGTMNLQLSSPIPAGTVFGYGQDLLYGDNWQFEKDDEHFDLSVRGDTLAVCAATATTPETCRLLSAISVAGDTAPDLPESDFSVSLGNLDNYVYTGETRATKESLQSYLLDAEQWIGSDSDTGVPGFKDQFQVVAAPLVEPVSVARLRTVSSAGQAESPIVGRAFHSRLLWGILLLACSYFLI